MEKKGRSDVRDFKPFTGVEVKMASTKATTGKIIAYVLGVILFGVALADSGYFGLFHIGLTCPYF